jgi:hypothetical protein
VKAGRDGWTAINRTRAMTPSTGDCCQPPHPGPQRQFPARRRLGGAGRHAPAAAARHHSRRPDHEHARRRRRTPGRHCGWAAGRQQDVAAAQANGGQGGRCGGGQLPRHALCPPAPHLAADELDCRCVRAAALRQRIGSGALSGPVTPLWRGDTCLCAPSHTHHPGRAGKRLAAAVRAKRTPSGAFANLDLAKAPVCRA